MLKMMTTIQFSWRCCWPMVATTKLIFVRWRSTTTMMLIMSPMTPMIMFRLAVAAALSIMVCILWMRLVDLANFLELPTHATDPSSGTCISHASYHSVARMPFATGEREKQRKRNANQLVEIIENRYQNSTKDWMDKYYVWSKELKTLFLNSSNDAIQLLLFDSFQYSSAYSVIYW